MADFPTETVLFEIESFASGTVLRVRGEVELATASAFNKALVMAREDEPGHVVISFEDCRLLDSMALTILIRHHRSLGTRLRLVVPSGVLVRRVLELTELAKRLRIFGTVEEALRTPEAA